ncbi:YicC/YloC family endoribonuclease [Methylomagnum ishizawai]|uniref:YicC/YloC family endoribonuclease n=1 Tax=Methylomagnum ishizawai TaxID=1760988 RepID=UPI001FEB4459|nr:YicC/YloC family endoribonuclease [Methylomagnum ishizawai]
MTAFAGAEREVQGWRFAWELRSVNHRYLDVALRLPDALRFLEPEARNRIAGRIKRGRVDATLSWKKTEQGEAAIHVNRALVAQLLAAAREVEALGGAALSGFNAFEVLKWPGALHEPEADREALAAAVLDLLAEALDKMVAGRGAEGRLLAGFIEERCLKMKEQVGAARARLPEVLQAMRQKVVARLQEVAANPDADRLEQELVYLAQKLDVAEELDRLGAHIDEVLRTLKQKEPVGRRLDFLLQELNREANTLGSKSADAETTRASVEMKVLIEQMREQIQNIE